MERAGHPENLTTARAEGLVGCRTCARVWPAGTPVCARCGSALHPREPMSLQRVWAWWIAGVIAYIPANLYPMLETRTLFVEESSTIVGGAIELATHGAPGIAAIILIASVVIPVGKFLAVAFLALSVSRPSSIPTGTRYALHEVVEYIGRWSMIDVFVVAILASLVQLQAVASITPGPAALTFALSVMFTMLSAQAFDSRMIWDSYQEDAA
ncbi:MAG: paraquat-inducible protein A [Pseudomonadota bacterium]